jgi:hypothetical protein
MNSPKTMWLRLLALLAIAGATLTSCAVSPNGPASTGASHGSLSNGDVSNYYYKKDAGWTYVFSNVEKVYPNSSAHCIGGCQPTTYTGSNDTVRTMGFDGFAPNGDSLFRVEISYRVLTTYAGRSPINIYYLAPGAFHQGAFVDGSVYGMSTMGKEPRPVSTDTILAGIVGRIRTKCDDFTNMGSYTWQIDTLWFSSHADSVYIWENIGTSGTLLVQSRCIFVKNFVQNSSWVYDVINVPTTTTCVVTDPSTSVTVPAGYFSNVADIRVYTPEVEDKGFNKEDKYFAWGVGCVYEYDWWYVTSNGTTFNKQDFTRSLISLTHN